MEYDESLLLLGWNEENGEDKRTIPNHAVARHGCLVDRIIFEGVECIL